MKIISFDMKNHILIKQSHLQKKSSNINFLLIKIIVNLKIIVILEVYTVVLHIAYAI